MGGCAVSSHCEDGQKIAISWTDADGCLSTEEYQCDSNCDGSCDQCNEGCDDSCNEDCDQNCNMGCDEECNSDCDGSCDGSCSCKDADAASTRVAASGAMLLAVG